MELYEVDFIECFHDCIQRSGEQVEERGVRDVPGRDDQKLRRPSVEQMAVAEVGVLRDDHATLCVGLLGELAVCGTVSVAQLAGVDCVVTSGLQDSDQTRR